MPCPVPATSRQEQSAPEIEAQAELPSDPQVKKFWHVPVAVAVAMEVSVVVVLVRSVTEMTSVTDAVSVTCTVTTGGVTVLIALVIGVATVVLSTVFVLVTEVVAVVCRQEHTRAISEAGRDKILEKMLAWTETAACLLSSVITDGTGGVGVMVVVTVTVLR